MPISTNKADGSYTSNKIEQPTKIKQKAYWKRKEEKKKQKKLEEEEKRRVCLLEKEALESQITNNREQISHEIEEMKDSIKKNMAKLGHDFGYQTKAKLAKNLRNMLSMFEQMI